MCGGGGSGGSLRDVVLLVVKTIAGCLLGRVMDDVCLLPLRLMM